NYTRRMLPRSREISNSWRRDDARAVNFTATGHKAQSDPVRNPRARFPGTLADDKAGLGIPPNQVMTQRPADEVDAFPGQWEFSSHAANTISTKKLSCLRSHSG